MNSVRTLPCFNAEQRERAHALLGIKVAHMMGRKLEEGDWATVYCGAKGIPDAGWSNLNIDVIHGNLGVEHKMLCYRSDQTVTSAYGTTLMHPAATRSIRIPSIESDPNEAMQEVLTQYAELMRERTRHVEAQNDTGKPVDMRTGWLLWQESLREFLYFEEPMWEPNPSDYYAQWVERTTRGTRKATKNLWVFEKQTGKKRFSITTSAGAKIQPYFDVPPPNDPNVYHFVVIGEHIALGRVRVWVTQSTAKELERVVGSLDADQVSNFIVSAISELDNSATIDPSFIESGTSVVVTERAYELLTSRVSGVNDDHCLRLLLDTAAET